MPYACSDFRIICLFSVFSTEVLLLAHLQTSVSKVRFRRLVRKFYYLRTCRLPYLRPVFKVWDGSFSHCIPTNLRRERVKGISGRQGRLAAPLPRASLLDCRFPGVLPIIHPDSNPPFLLTSRVQFLPSHSNKNGWRDAIHFYWSG
jgi:hypothetical protein